MISYNRLWKLLEKKGYSQKDIIWLARISESTYHKLKANDAVRMDILERICKAGMYAVSERNRFLPFPLIPKARNYPQATGYPQ